MGFCFLVLKLNPRMLPSLGTLLLNLLFEKYLIKLLEIFDIIVSESTTQL